MSHPLQIISQVLLEDYKVRQPLTLSKHFEALKRKGKHVDFDFYISYAAVYSSNIEGNIMDFDTYTRVRLSGMNATGKSFREIEDLRAAYLFARGAALDESNFLQAHNIASQTIIEEDKYRGTYRDREVYVVKDAKIVYTGCPVVDIPLEMQKLFTDIATLLSSELTIEEVFYYASMLHLCFVHIHPFADGNGRTARLLEKWFLSIKLGEASWLIPSEKLYHERIRMYYKNVDLGVDYPSLNYAYALPFLLMLPMALKIK